MTPPAKDKSPVIPALLIILAVGFGFYLIPNAMIWLADFSPWLAAAFGTLAVLSFFLVFWLRARYQRRHGSDQD